MAPSNPGFDKRRIFEGHALFAGMAPAELDQLIAHARIERHAPHANIFAKGAPGHGMMAVLDGQVKICSPSPDGKEVVLNVVEAGGVFGEMALLDGKDRSADAVALTECELLLVDRRDFVAFLERNPRFCIRLIALLCERLRRTSEQVEDVLFLDVPGRVAKTLLRLAQQHGKPSDDGTLIDLKLSQRELGGMAGLTRESVNKQLRRWQAEGLIALKGNAITLLDEDRLADLALGGDED